MAFKLDGKARLDQKIADMPEAVRKGISEAIAEGMAELNDYQRRLADPYSKTGELVRSIGWGWVTPGQPGLTGLKPGRAANLGKKGELQLAAKAYAGVTPTGQAYYARWIEFGTRYQRPRPFFFPAYRVKKPAIKRKMALASRKAIKALAAK